MPVLEFGLVLLVWALLVGCVWLVPVLGQEMVMCLTLVMVLVCVTVVVVCVVPVGYVWPVAELRLVVAVCVMMMLVLVLVRGACGVRGVGEIRVASAGVGTGVDGVHDVGAMTCGVVGACV
jgi:peptidoglycan/LPS O-acetylase OafA/YrhL